MNIFHRHFTSPHPLFLKTKTPSGVHWKKSIYYLWWEYLRRNEDYKKACKQQSKGKYARLYRDFGDVHATDFKTWWTKEGRGVKLFAEPAVPMTVDTLSIVELKVLAAGWDPNSLLVITIPLNLPKRHISKRVAAMLKKYHPRKRGQQMLKESKARYRITHKFNFNALKTALELYDYKLANPTAKLWEIAQKYNMGKTLTAAELALPRGSKDSEVGYKKNAMSVAVSQKLKKAKSIIKNVGLGKFPGPH